MHSGLIRVAGAWFAAAELCELAQWQVIKNCGHSNGRFVEMTYGGNWHVHAQYATRNLSFIPHSSNNQTPINNQGVCHGNHS